MSADPRREIADVTLERYCLGELSAEAAASLKERLQDDAGLRRRLEALQRSDEDIRESDGLAAVAARVQQRLAADARTPVPGIRWAVPAAAAMVVALLLVVPRVTTVSPVEDEERIKGLQPSLTVFRQAANGSETLADGAVAHPGDLVRVGYRAAGRAYGVILSIDGNRSITMHLPRHGEAAAPLGREATVLLDHAYELDAAPKWEQFYFVTGNDPFMIAPIVASVARAVTDGPGKPAALMLPAGLEQSTFLLLKEGKP